MIVGETRADIKHFWKMPDSKEELYRSVRDGRIESRHSFKSLEGMGCLKITEFPERCSVVTKCPFVYQYMFGSYHKDHKNI